MSITVVARVVIGLPIRNAVTIKIETRQKKQFDVNTGNPYTVPEYIEHTFLFDNEVNDIDFLYTNEDSSEEVSIYSSKSEDGEKVIGIPMLTDQNWDRSDVVSASQLDVNKFWQFAEEKFKAIGWNKEKHAPLSLHLVLYIG